MGFVKKHELHNMQIKQIKEETSMVVPCQPWTGDDSHQTFKDFASAVITEGVEITELSFADLRESFNHVIPFAGIAGLPTISLIVWNYT